jgi:hypothetical protein
MSELVNLVARLEREVREAKEAHDVADRLWDLAEETLDEIRTLSSTLSECHFNIDGYVADNDYPAVEQSAYEIRGATDADRLLPLVRRAMLLLALRDGTPPPAAGALESLPEITPAEAGHPTLTLEELMRDSERELGSHEEALRKIWCDEDDAAELDEHLDSARFDAVQDRATRAGRQLMELCEYICEELCPKLVHSTEQGRIENALRTLAAIDIAGKEAPNAYKVYEVALSEQYERSPSSLGAMGEHLMLFETWIASQKPPR